MLTKGVLAAGIAIGGGAAAQGMDVYAAELENPEENHGETVELQAAEEPTNDVSAEESVQEPMQEVTQEPVQEPVQEVTQESVQESIQEVAQDSVHNSIQETVEEPVQNSVQEVIQETVETSDQEITQGNKANTQGSILSEFDSQTVESETSKESASEAFAEQKEESEKTFDATSNSIDDSESLSVSLTNSEEQPESNSELTKKSTTADESELTSSTEFESLSESASVSELESESGEVNNSVSMSESVAFSMSASALESESASESASSSMSYDEKKSEIKDLTESMAKLRSLIRSKYALGTSVSMASLTDEATESGMTVEEYLQIIWDTVGEYSIYGDTVTIKGDIQSDIAANKIDFTNQKSFGGDTCYDVQKQATYIGDLTQDNQLIEPETAVSKLIFSDAKITLADGSQKNRFEILTEDGQYITSYIDENGNVKKAGGNCAFVFRYAEDGTRIAYQIDMRNSGKIEFVYGSSPIQLDKISDAADAISKKTADTSLNYIDNNKTEIDLSGKTSGTSVAEVQFDNKGVYFDGKNSSENTLENRKLYIKLDVQDGKVLNDTLVINVKYTGDASDEKNTTMSLGEMVFTINGVDKKSSELYDATVESDLGKIAAQLYKKIIFNFGTYSGKLTIMDVFGTIIAPNATVVNAKGRGTLIAEDITAGGQGEWHSISSESTSTSESSSQSQTTSQSESTSVSQSQSESTSVSQSESESTSISQSQSESTSVSQSESESTSVSQSQSESASVSQSESESASVSQSESESTSVSQSQSESTSVSQSESESTSVSQSESESTSVSQSESESTSVSQSQSESASVSQSQSESTSVSQSESESTSVSQSGSTSVSGSQSTSTSTSTSQSVSLSNSASVSTSESASTSYSESESSSVLGVSRSHGQDAGNDRSGETGGQVLGTRRVKTGDEGRILADAVTAGTSGGFLGLMAAFRRRRNKHNTGKK